MTPLQIFLSNTMQYEGMFSQDTRDPGNWTGGTCGRGECLGTMRGISTAAYPGILKGLSPADRAAGAPWPVKVADLTPAQTDIIYAAEYWYAAHANLLPPALAIVYADFGVNSGPGTAARILQGVVGARQDGQIGNETVKAIASLATPEHGGLAGLVARYQGEHVRYLMALPLWQTQGLGWERRAISIALCAGRMIGGL